MERVVKLKDGTYGTVIREWNWQDIPYLKVYKDVTYKERLYEDFVDIELDAKLKTHKYNMGPLPIESNFHKVHTLCVKADIEYVDLLN